MNQTHIITALFVGILICGTAAADWNVTWTPVKESIIDKEYIIEVQNMQSVKRDVNISSFFAETSFDMSGLSDIEFYEWKDIPYTYTVNHYDEVDHSEYDSANGTWNNWTENVYNWTETIESTKLDWKACKSQMFKETASTKEDNYGHINIPAYGSKPKDDGTINGTKIFMLKFKTPITYTNSYGSNGKVALLLDNVEYHPYWNVSWSARKEIILTGHSSLSLDNPIEDGYIYDTTAYNRFNTSDFIRFGRNEDVMAIYRGYIEWDISSVPSDAIILGVKLKYHGYSNNLDGHIHEMVGTQPSISGNQAVYDETGEGTVYADVAGFPVVGTNQEIDLGVDAVSDLQSSISNGWFAIGLQGDGEPAGMAIEQIYSEDYATVNPKPTLYIEYGLTDYQILLNISYESGMQADFDDLRFCNDTDEIDSWLESKVDGSYALVWVEFPTTPASGVNQTYYMYYGNAGVSSVWNGTATFLSFFDGDSTGWTETDPNAHISFANNRLEFSGLHRAEDAYVYQSFTQSEWVCEEVYAITTATTAGIFISPATSGEIDDMAGTADGAFTQYYKGTSSFVGLRISSVGYNGGAQTIPLGTYYLRTTKSGNTITTNWYSDALRTNQVYTSTVTQTGLPSLSYIYMLNTWNSGTSGYTVSGWIDDFMVRKYAANPPTYVFGDIEYYTDSIHYNATNPYNHTIDSSGAIAVNRTIVTADDINWTAAALTDDCHLMVTEYNLSNSTITNFTIYSNTLDWLQVTNLTPAYAYRLQYANGTEINLTNADANGIINYSVNLVPDDYQIVLGDKSVNITLHSSYPTGDLQTNYTGIVKLNYIVESNFPVNYSSLAFLWGMNHTPTSDMHSYLKVPANSIAADGIYRAHNRNTTPYLSWEGNSTITDGNVWQWNGGDNDSFWIAKQSINATHTWINVSGETTNMFPSMFYLGRNAMYSAPKTGFEINKGQGIIMKIWDLEQFRGRSNDYYISLFFDTGLEATPSGNIELWYCNDSFNPATHDPKDYCDYKESLHSTRWTTHRDYQPHANVSFCEPLTISADIPSCSCPPTEVNYLYLYSNTVSSKSYILNATNSDPGICNLTFAQTNTMWTFDEVSKTSTPVAYTPSIFQLFTRDYEKMDFQLYIANDQDVWGNSGIDNKSVGVSDVPPTHCRYNYFWWNNTTDYNMTNLYTENFYVNITYGFDPDNGESLNHTLSLYTSGGSFVATINDTLSGNQTDEDIFFDIDEYVGNYQFRIVSTDNEGSTSTSWSPVFVLSRGTDEEIPLNLFIVLMVLMFGSLFYIYHAETYISKIVTSLITTWMSFMLSSMIVSGTVVLNYAELSTADAFVYGSHSIQIASLSHFFMFTGVVSALFMLTFAVKLVIDTYLGMQEKRKADEEWDGVEQ